MEDEDEVEEEEGIGLEPQQEMSVVPVASKPLTLKIKLGSEVLTPDSKSRWRRTVATFIDDHVEVVRKKPGLNSC